MIDSLKLNRLCLTDLILNKSEQKLYKSLEKELGNSNLTEVATELKALEISYTALYSTINRTFELSLTNFLR